MAKSSNASLLLLKDRFHAHMHRHPGLDWAAVESRIVAKPKLLATIQAMERTGGEPDIVGQSSANGAYLVCDCSGESPAERRSLCYDREALESRKQAKPRHSAMDAAAEMGLQLLTESQYRELQALGDFDTKTSSWIHTPAEVRKLGGALFGDRRFGRVFIYHNGAESYYAARGFRGIVHI